GLRRHRAGGDAAPHHRRAQRLVPGGVAARAALRRLTALALPPSAAHALAVRMLLPLLVVLGCNGHVVAPPQRVVMETALTRVYQQLREAGPVRFAQVDAHLYRGGQPTAAQVRWLHDLGVRTIVC